MNFCEHVGQSMKNDSYITEKLTLLVKNVNHKMIELVVSKNNYCHETVLLGTCSWLKYRCKKVLIVLL